MLHHAWCQALWVFKTARNMELRLNSTAFGVSRHNAHLIHMAVLMSVLACMHQMTPSWIKHIQSVLTAQSE